jgi:hypothetical protein
LAGDRESAANDSQTVGTPIATDKRLTAAIVLALGLKIWAIQGCSVAARGNRNPTARPLGTPASPRMTRVMATCLC